MLEIIGTIRKFWLLKKAKPYHHKSQSAMEFILLASFMLFVVFGFFTLTSSKVLEARQDANQKTAEDIAEFAYRELEIAKSVNDGYIRVFFVPQTINIVNYSIRIVDNRELIINYLDNEYVRFLTSNISGNITKGYNEIKKEKGIIYVGPVPPQCENGKDDDNDKLIDATDPGCYAGCDYLNPTRYNKENLEKDSCKCASVGKCCESGAGSHYASFDNDCYGDECWTSCLPYGIFKIKNNLIRVLSFKSDGSVVIKGTLQQNSNPIPTDDDEFMVKDSSGNYIAVMNLVTGNMLIKGNLFENQASLNPSDSTNDFVVADTSGNVVSYIDESGNLRLKGALTQNGNP